MYSIEVVKPNRASLLFLLYFCPLRGLYERKFSINSLLLNILKEISA